MVNFFTNYENQCCMAQVKQLQQPFQNAKNAKNSKNTAVSKKFKKLITLFRVIPTTTFQNSHLRLYVSLIGPGEGRHTTHFLKCVLTLCTSQTDWKQSSAILSDRSFDIISDISFGTLSDISYDILSDISFDISSDILSDISFEILSYISSDISSDILSDISSDILSDISCDISFGILSDISSDISFHKSADILSDLSFDTLSDISSDILSDISLDILSDISSDISFDILSDIRSLTFFLTFLATNCLSKTKHSIHSFTQKPLHKLYIYLTPRSKSNIHDDFASVKCLASDSPAKKQLSPKMQSACSNTHTPHASDSLAKKSS